jgi:hypothetical protein
VGNRDGLCLTFTTLHVSLAVEPGVPEIFDAMMRFMELVRDTP